MIRVIYCRAFLPVDRDRFVEAFVARAKSHEHVSTLFLLRIPPCLVLPSTAYIAHRCFPNYSTRLRHPSTDLVCLTHSRHIFYPHPHRPPLSNDCYRLLHTTAAWGYHTSPVLEEMISTCLSAQYTASRNPLGVTATKSSKITAKTGAILAGKTH